MKKMLKILSAVLFMALALSCNISAAPEPESEPEPQPTPAAPSNPADTAVSERTLDVYLYNNYEDCVFMINWSNTQQAASILLKGPNNKTITATQQNTVFGKGSAVISAGSVEGGRWYL